MPVVDLLSWNLNGLDDRALDARSEAAVQEALLGVSVESAFAGAKPRAFPDVLLFQEVVVRSFHAHLGPNLEAAGYVLYPNRAPDRSYFEVVAVRPPWTVTNYQTEALYKSRYGRWQHQLTLAHDQHVLTVLTAHLDSGAQATAERLAQVRDLAQQMTGPAVFAGDTNLRAAEWKRLQQDELAVRDIWEVLGKDPDTRWTWIGRKRKARYDRAWISPDIQPRSFELVGGVGEAAPSDHRGIRFAVEI